MGRGAQRIRDLVARTAGLFFGRPSLMICAPLLVAACGFTPVYGPQGVARGLYGQIQVAPPRDVPGYILARELQQRLGLVDGAAPYDLTAEVDVNETGLGITPDQEITRICLQGTLSYRLSDSSTGAAIRTGSVQNFTSYSAPVFSAARQSIAGNSVTVAVAEEDAVERLMTILADQLVAELLATAPDWRGPTP
ncbi:LPS-assembly lipoprotein [Palleronia salina]|uniref:LPS-assembly lipoprotein n=2 Tax=Palleronia salina TaxID=313368 RepID=A0A1M6DI96_9RHOB|nr:LPS-assembly lipoprotein [Palleronia salina]